MGLVDVETSRPPAPSAEEAQAMAEHLMMSMNHGPAGGGLHGYRMGMNGGLQAGPQQHPPTAGLRGLPNGQMMHYGGPQGGGMEAGMRQRPGGMGAAGRWDTTTRPMGGNMMYNGQSQPPPHHPQQQQQQHPHMHHGHPQQQPQQPPQQYMTGGLTSQQLMASMHLQKLNTQYHGHPLGGMNGTHLGGGGPQYRVSSAQLAGMQHVGGPVAAAALGLNVMDTDLIDEEVLWEGGGEVRLEERRGRGLFLCLTVPVPAHRK
ncbi:hypothetical protein JZ751_017259 [Albula glossodonta]|uniref:Uncharacterized protein n=1 Tax=Albula glossodonta TaxID=121402 RepID=A0A8T2MQD2_9TELE|nr:hypothetical protein JZ751_017259 [Albula glossodonta]